MARKDRIIGGQLIAFDSETNELMVKVSGMTIEVEDLDIGNVNPLNVAGEKVNPSTEEKQTTLNAQVGALTDVPVAYNGDDESAISRSGISLWKRMCNALKAIAATLVTLNGKVTACNTGAVVVSSSALPSGAATAEAQASLLAAVAKQEPYSNVLAGYLTLSGSEEVLIPGWTMEKDFLAANFCTHTDKIYYALQNTTGHEPGLEGSAAYWQEVTPRAVLLWANDDNTADVYRGSALRQERTLAISGMADKVAVDTTGLLAMYVIGTAADVIEIEVYE
jgi:hypothetical protein